ncbi:MAG: primosomal protein N', partial [Desulfitobacteriaceae bacterium]|nr:primosomal protein N' [Desulfitobacteriaceae bacterium]
QLITQVAGRAGRGEKPGEVVLQTYHPQDPAIMLAARQDYPAFIRMEIENRKAASYPPFGYLIRVLFTCRELPMLERTIDECTRYIREELPPKAALLGPAPAPLERIKDRFRMHLVLKGNNLLSLRSGLQAGLKKAAEIGAAKKSVNIAIDIEPVNMM